MLNTERPGPRCRLGFLIVAATGVCLAGCAVHKQVQYFAATDPETGATNYYRMTVTGSGGGFVNYHVQAGYFSAAAVDILRGSMPDVPELDLPVERLEVFDWLNAHFFASLIQEAKRLRHVFDQEALRVSLQGAVAYADERVANAEADISKYGAELTTAQARQTAKEQAQAEARTLVEAQRAALLQARLELSHATASLDGLKGELSALETAVAAVHSEVASLEATLARLDSEAAVLKASAEAEGATEADKQAAADKHAEAEAARENLAGRQTRADEAATELAGKREARTAAERLVTDKTRAVTESATNLQGAEAKERSAAREAEAAGRAVRGLQDKVTRLTVDKVRQQAARDVAHETLSRLEESGDAPAPFGPLAEGQEAPPLDDAKVIELARLIWYGSLSSSDLASIGMTGNTSPYQFRKLVFWATAANIDLNEMAGEIDGILDNVGAVASAFRTQAKARKVKEDARRKAMGSILDGLELGPQGALIRGLLDMENPPAGESVPGIEGLIGGSP
jgi:hypothetical protein